MDYQRIKGVPVSGKKPDDEFLNSFVTVWYGTTALGLMIQNKETEAVKDLLRLSQGQLAIVRVAASRLGSVIADVIANKLDGDQNRKE